MAVKNKIREALIKPPPQKMIVDEHGTPIKMVQLNDVLTPQFRKCDTCSARGRCSKVQKKKDKFLNVDCVIEKTLLDVLLLRLSLEGVSTQDELLIFPLVRNMFVMTRTYEIETLMDLNMILRDEDAMKVYKDMMGIVGKAEAQYIKILKELLATRKESTKKSVHTLKNQKNTYDLALKLSEKNAD